MAEPGSDVEARFGELEARAAEQEKSILELSDELYRQQRQIAELKTQLQHVVERTNANAAAPPLPDPEDETPPHY